MSVVETVVTLRGGTVTGVWEQPGIQLQPFHSENIDGKTYDYWVPIDRN